MSRPRRPDVIPIRSDTSPLAGLARLLLAVAARRRAARTAGLEKKRAAAK